MFKSSQKGVSLFLTITILSIILAIAFGLSTILISQIRTIQKMGYSVVAFYAADTGTEKALEPVLKYIKAEVATGETGSFPGGFEFSGNIDIDGSIADYEIEIYCCDDADVSCWFNNSSKDCSDISLTENPDPLDPCQATFFCIEVLGEYRSTKRAIKTRLFPIP